MERLPAYARDQRSGDETAKASVARKFERDKVGVRVNPAAPATPDYEMPAEPVLEAFRQREAWELGEAEGRATLRRFEIRQPDPSLQNALRTLAKQVSDLHRGGANA